MGCTCYLYCFWVKGTKKAEVKMKMDSTKKGHGDKNDVLFTSDNKSLKNP